MTDLDNLRARVEAKRRETTAQGRQRLLDFERAPESVKEAFWAEVRDATEAEREFDQWRREVDSSAPGLPELPEARLRTPPVWDESWSRRARLARMPKPPERSHPSFDHRLAAMSPRDYWLALTGEEVPPSGVVACPAHDDLDPSCHVYRAPDRGWYCYVCGAGGSAIDLAAALTGIEPRGRGFMELRGWIAERIR